MYRKRAVKIRVVAVCLLFVCGIINTFIGFSVVNNFHALIGVFMLAAGVIVPYVLYSLISDICDIIDDTYYDVRNIKKYLKQQNDGVCPCCKQTVSKEEE